MIESHTTYRPWKSLVFLTDAFKSPLCLPASAGSPLFLFLLGHPSSCLLPIALLFCVFSPFLFLFMLGIFSLFQVKSGLPVLLATFSLAESCSWGMCYSVWHFKVFSKAETISFCKELCCSILKWYLFALSLQA